MSTTRKIATEKTSVVYGMGFMGALVYFLVHATSFWLGIAGFFKAIFWPAFLIYYVLDYLNR